MSVYKPGNLDWAANRMRSQRKAERRAREANSPTGTEIGQISQKLQALTAQLKTVQDQQATMIQTLQSQQQAIEANVNEIKRVTPDPSGDSKSTGSVTTSGETEAHSWSVAVAAGKSQAFTALSVKAEYSSTSGLPPILEIYDGGTLVMATPLYGASVTNGNGCTFTQTINGPHTYSIRVRSIDGASHTVSNIVSWFSVTQFA